MDMIWLNIVSIGAMLYSGCIGVSAGIITHDTCMIVAGIVCFALAIGMSVLLWKLRKAAQVPTKETDMEYSDCDKLKVDIDKRIDVAEDLKGQLHDLRRENEDILREAGVLPLTKETEHVAD